MVANFFIARISIDDGQTSRQVANTSLEITVVEGSWMLCFARKIFYFVVQIPKYPMKITLEICKKNGTLLASVLFVDG